MYQVIQVCFLNRFIQKSLTVNLNWMLWVQCYQRWGTNFALCKPSLQYLLNFYPWLLASIWHPFSWWTLYQQNCCKWCISICVLVSPPIQCWLCVYLCISHQCLEPHGQIFRLQTYAILLQFGWWRSWGGWRNYHVSMLATMITCPLLTVHLWFWDMQK